MKTPEVATHTHTHTQVLQLQHRFTVQGPTVINRRALITALCNPPLALYNEL